jgi:hypothetical protein
MAFLAAVPALLGTIGAAGGTAAAAGGAAAGVATAASAAGGLTMLGTGLAAGGSLLAGASSFAASRTQAAIANNNAKILQVQANQSRMAGQTAESQHRTQVSQLIGEQTAAQAANGVDINSASSSAVRDSTRTMGDFDALTIRYNAAKQAWGQDTEALNQKNTAAQSKRAGTMALLGSFIGAASSVAGGLGKLASMGQANAMAGIGAGQSIDRAASASAFQDFIPTPSLAG